MKILTPANYAFDCVVCSSFHILLDSLCGLFINSVADVMKRFANVDPKLPIEM
jgi:hypothetical protein